MTAVSIYLSHDQNALTDGPTSHAQDMYPLISSNRAQVMKSMKTTILQQLETTTQCYVSPNCLELQNICTSLHWIWYTSRTSFWRHWNKHKRESLQSEAERAYLPVDLEHSGVCFK